MSYVKVMIHTVWGTKNHYPFLTKEIKQKIIAHIKENAYKKQIFIDRQEEHHKKVTFMREYEEFIKKYNFKSHG